MKSLNLAGFCFLALGVNHAMAQCTSPLTSSQLSTLLEGNYACGTSGTETWDELHSGGTLTDYKKGPPAPGNNDPSQVVGTYAYVPVGRSSAAVQYTYPGGLKFTYYVQGQPGTPPATAYYFCPTTGSAPVLNITVQATHCY